MPVDPAVRRLLDEWGESEEFDLATARAGMDAWAVPDLEAPAGVAIEDGEIAGVPVRTYEPEADLGGPTLVWCHGGGYVLGTAGSADPLGRFFAARLGWSMVSVDYRLAPEHPFPAAVEDTVAVLRGLAEDGPVVMGGDSAGGGLAAAACLVTRADGVPVVAQVLLNPFLDATLSFRSVDEFARGYGLTRAALREFARLYVAGADPADFRCSPVLAESLEGLPPPVIVTAEFDPLRDEAEAYAARLADAGVRVEVRRWDGMVHGFFGMFDVTPTASESLEWTASALERLARDYSGLSA